jgi:predicted amidohydrolase
MLARERGCTILGSIMSEGQNMGFCIDANGMQSRPKVHPFGPEKKHFVGGDFIAPIPTRLGKIGLQICYDLRFPEVARALTLKGADLLVTIAQFPAERKDHWRTLCIARAIENQIHHLACNCAGQGFAGGSMIVDPWGRVLKEAGPNQELILEEIDIADRDRIRQKLPCLDDRRPELY